MSPPKRTHRNAERALAATLALVVWLVLTPLSAGRAAADEPVEFVITDPRIAESSGLATDTRRDLYWTVNDSDDSGIAYAIDGIGKTVGTLTYRANPFDVESIAYRDGRLYIGDTGGNRRPRDVITVYEFADPAPDNTEQPFTHRDFQFPDGPHDTEALLIDAAGSIFVVTKDAEGGGIYAASGIASGPDEPESLTYVAGAPPYVTDGAFLADGRIALRSYVGIYVLDPRSFAVVASAATPTLPQSESVTLPLAGSGLLIGTEGQQSKVLRVPVPNKVGPVPSITPSAQSPETAQPSEGSTPAASPSRSSGSGTGMTFVVAGVIGIALAAAVAASRVRRRR